MIYQILILIVSIPAGLLIAYACRDELIDGRKWFRILFIAGIIFGVGLRLAGYYSASWTSYAIAIIAMISYIKSFDKKWTRK